MINSTLYPRNNALQRRDASYIIDNYFHLLKWKSNENILDVGTGDGGVFFDIVLPKFPKNIGKITALDIDENMLHLAKKTFKHNPEIGFHCMDIASRPIPKQLYQNFDHIFSFYCLHFVQDHRDLMQILFEMLRPGGEILFSIVTKHAIYDTYRRLANLDKWKPFMAHLTHMGQSDNPVHEMEFYLKNAGFVNSTCEIIDFQFTHQVSAFLEFIISINPFMKNIPQEQHENHGNDLLRELKTFDTVTVKYRDGVEHSVCINYQAMVVFASKKL